MNDLIEITVPVIIFIVTLLAGMPPSTYSIFPTLSDNKQDMDKHYTCPDYEFVSGSRFFNKTKICMYEMAFWAGLNGYKLRCTGGNLSFYNNITHDYIGIFENNKMKKCNNSRTRFLLFPLPEDDPIE